LCSLSRTFSQITTPLLCDDLSLSSSFSSQDVSVDFCLGPLFGVRERFGGKFIFQKSPFVDSSLLYCTRSRIRAIKYVSLLLSARRTPARALSRYLSLDCARVGVSLLGDTSERVGNKIKSLPRLFRSVCVRVRAFSKDV